MSRNGLFLAGAVVAIFSLSGGCPQPNSNENSNGTNTNTNGDTNTNGSTNTNANSSADGNSNSGSSGDMAQLVLRFDAPTTIAFVGVDVFVNKGNVHRADAGVGSFIRDFRTSWNPPSAGGFTMSYPRGTQICLICDETEGITSAANVGVAPIPDSQAGQFVEWQGDIQGNGGQDAGSLFFTLNEDRTIVARFSAMQAVAIRSVGGALGTGTTLDLQILNQAPLSIPPQFVSSPPNGLRMVGTGVTGQQGQIGAFYYFRDGTVLKFTVRDDVPFISWSGDGAIGGRVVTFTCGERTQIADLNWP